ncbi:hypothetical protein HL653_11820 [Sphingomonas sp. AP4-R1]|uniref:hypothetical protein n=1 Tax=Sphingomonas sp. AP4-R1 TaxID=2735134 RepID=UPI0014939BF1|nr:hypothetical protein [Sphingomonas sp. AP4-R1]QJU56369.1 hypothetical protein HL653_11820 [Sphingomonas sp. AP4-R1]
MSQRNQQPRRQGAGRVRAPLPNGCRYLDPAVASLMVAAVHAQTDEALTDQFGLSYNTWRKIKLGMPIRASLADRVEQRVRGQQCPT